MVYKKQLYSPAFTIVELLVVIVVIGILAAITIVAYTGITQRATAAGLIFDLDNASKQLKLYQVEHNAFPVSLDANNCPQDSTPTVDNNYCLKPSNGTTFQYTASNTLSPPTFNLTALNNSQTYSIGGNSPAVPSGQNLLAGDTSVERTSGYEFLAYADLAPIFNNYGLIQYTISFDIKSANIAVQNNMSVYQQNGNGFRYAFFASVPVTTSYAKQSITVTPTLLNPDIEQSMLAFYGTYGTGNNPTVKNVKVELGSVATDWTQAP